MKVFISVVIAIIGSFLMVLSLEQFFSIERKAKRDIPLFIIGLLICILNVILFEKIL